MRAWYWHFGIGAVLAAVTWYLTIRGRGKSAFVSFGLSGNLLLMLTLVNWGRPYRRCSQRRARRCFHGYAAKLPHWLTPFIISSPDP